MDHEHPKPLTLNPKPRHSARLLLAPGSLTLGKRLIIACSFLTLMQHVAGGSAVRGFPLAICRHAVIGYIMVSWVVRIWCYYQPGLMNMLQGQPIPFGSIVGTQIIAPLLRNDVPCGNKSS